MQVGERQPGVDDVFDDQDVSVLDRGVEILQDPDDARGVDSGPVARDRHEVDLAGKLDAAHEVGHEEDRALEDAHQEQARGPRSRAVISAPSSAMRPWSVASSIRICCDAGLELGSRACGPSRFPPRHDGIFPSRRGREARNRHDLVSSDDERPGLALRAGHLRVHEHILDLLPPAREPVARPPRAHVRPRVARRDQPLAPAHGPSSATGDALEPDAVVLPDRRRAAAEVEPRRSDGRVEERGERQAGSVRRSASFRRFASARGWSPGAAAGARSRIRPRFVSGFEESSR